MFKQIAILLVLLGLSWMFWPRFHRASAFPENGLEVTITIWPMQSIHSEWHRRVNISYNDKEISKRLMGDTGWWRGSNLYRHRSGAYLVHEGQGWCFAFTLEPLEFSTSFEKSCVKNQIEVAPSGARSRFYQDLFYLGHFHETKRKDQEARIRYFEADTTPEIELPQGP